MILDYFGKYILAIRDSLGSIFTFIHIEELFCMKSQWGL